MCLCQNDEGERCILTSIESTLAINDIVKEKEGNSFVVCHQEL